MVMRTSSAPTLVSVTSPSTIPKLPPPLPPQTLGHGRYHSLQCRLGMGMYGGVWLYADRLAGGKRVAVKEVQLRMAQRMLTLHEGHDNPFCERSVVQEIAHHGGHAHVLHAQQEFCEAGSWFLVSDWCSGGDLHGILQRLPGGRMNERVALSCFRQIVRGVHFLHRVVGVAHRDLSLENVLEHEGVCKISDFGLAVRVTSRCRGRVGKAYYMAPEVVASEDDDGAERNSSNDGDEARWGATGRHYDPAAADVWSLGIVLFVLVTGSPLVPCASLTEPSFRALRQVGVESVLAAWGHRDGLSEQAIDLLKRLLQLTPEKRLGTSEILAHPALAVLLPSMTGKDFEHMP